MRERGVASEDGFGKKSLGPVRSAEKLYEKYSITGLAEAI